MASMGLCPSDKGAFCWMFVPFFPANDIVYRTLLFNPFHTKTELAELHCVAIQKLGHKTLKGRQFAIEPTKLYMNVLFLVREFYTGPSYS